MAESGLKRFWNAIKPPPSVPRRPSGHSPLRSRSFWDFLKPPPAVTQPEGEVSRSPEERRRRKRLVVVTALAILIGGGGWGVYLYGSSAPQRAEAVLQEAMRLMASGKFREAVNYSSKATD